jgi:hypothetical protein
MLSVLLIGSLAILVNLLIQVAGIVVIVGYIARLVDAGGLVPTIGNDIKLMSLVLMALLFGHVLQFALWAGLFLYIGEFSDFSAAFYHSVVNFTSLGYGDIVMSEKWRLLGALEAANGILMFGLTTSLFVAVLNRLFTRHKTFAHVMKNTPADDPAAGS